MQDFINMASQQLGISTQQSTSATAGILGMLQKNMGGGDFGKLLGNLPGAGDLLAKAGGGSSGGSGGGGLGGMLGGMLGGGGGGGGGGNALGGIMQAAGGLLGGKGGGGDTLGMLGGVLGSSGLSMDKLAPLMGMFMQYVQGKAGQGGVNSILGALPDLKKFVG